MTNTDRRKIQKTGVATYTVSLPKSWIVKNGIKAGDSISILEEKDKSLRLNLGEKENEVTEEVINARECRTDVELIRKFTAHYLNGISKVTINFDAPVSSEYKKKILEHIKMVIGFEIVEETESKLVIQDFFSSNYLSIEKAIRRAFNISKIMLSENKKLLTKEYTSLDNIRIWEEEVDKLYLLVRRQLNFAVHSSTTLRQLNITLSECLNYLILIGSIEKITDAFFEVAESASALDKVPEKYLNLLLRMSDEMAETYEMAINSVFRKDFAFAHKALEMNKKIAMSIPAKRENMPDDRRLVHLYLIMFNLHTAISFITEIAEIGLDIR